MWSDNQFEKSEMSSVCEASVLLRSIAEPRPVGDSIKSAIGRAADKLGWQFGRTRTIWYKNVRRIESKEMDELRECAARNEAQAAVKNLLALRERLTAADSDFHQPTLAALDDALRAMGADVGAVALSEE